MENVFLIAIWVFCTLAFISFVYIDIKNQENYRKSRHLSLDSSAQNSCVYKDLPELNDKNSKCCKDSGNRLFKNYEISTVPTYYATICQEACTKGIKPGGSGCIEEIGNNEYKSCMELLKPDCKNSAKPLARKGTELWYAKHYSDINCSEFVKCSE